MKQNQETRQTSSQQERSKPTEQSLAEQIESQSFNPQHIGNKPHPLSPAEVIQLQRTIGNKRVSRLVASPTPPLNIKNQPPKFTVQRDKKHAQKYIKSENLDIEANQETIQQYIDDTKNPEKHRRQLLIEWNRTRSTNKRPIDLQVAIPSDLKATATSVSGTKDFTGYNSDEHQDIDAKTILQNKPKLILKRGTGSNNTFPQMDIAELIEVARQLVKNNEIPNLQSVVVDIGGTMVEFFVSSYGNDILAVPLVQTNDSPSNPEYQREGKLTQYSWAEIADTLDTEIENEHQNQKTSNNNNNAMPRSKMKMRKQKLHDIFYSLEGGSPTLTPGMSIAVGAIACDLMKGVGGAMAYIKKAEQFANDTDNWTFKDIFAKGANSAYEPAMVGGRHLATDKTQELKNNNNNNNSAQNDLILPLSESEEDTDNKWLQNQTITNNASSSADENNNNNRMSSIHDKDDELDTLMNRPADLSSDNENDNHPIKSAKLEEFDSSEE